MLRYCYSFSVVFLLTEIFVINNYNFVDGNESTGIDITKLKIIRGHSSEITSWTYYTEEHGSEAANRNKPLMTGLIATTDSETILIRDLNSGVVIEEIFPSEIVGYGCCIDMLEFSSNHKYLAIATRLQYSISGGFEGMLIVFWDIEKRKKLQYKIVLESCITISSMNYSADGKFICLFIENDLPDHKRETSLQVYGVSGKIPLKINSAYKKIPFQIHSRHFKGITENQLEKLLNESEFYEWNARFVTPSPNDNYKYYFLQNIKSPNWTEKKLFGATSIISPNKQKVATLYPNGELHVWNTTTGDTCAKYKFDIQYRRAPKYFETVRDNFIHDFHFADDKFILLETDESVLVYDVDQNSLINVCTPPTNKPITKYLDLLGTEIYGTTLYMGNILKLQKNGVTLIYQIGKSNTLLLTRDCVDDNFSSTHRYILFKMESLYELWDNETCRIISLNIRSIDDLHYLSFSQDDKFILFYKESVSDVDRLRMYYQPDRQQKEFFRYDISKNKLEPMNGLNNIEPAKIKRKLSVSKRTDKMMSKTKPAGENENMSYFNVDGVVNSKNELLVEHGDEIIVLNPLTFGLLRRQKIGIDETSEELKRLSHRSEQVDRHQVFIYDNQSRLKQITLRFDVDDYLIINPTNNNVTGSPKGLKRFIPNK